MRHIDLFSGIGGFALAADRVFGDVEHIFCDNDLFCQEVLKKHWPNSKIYGDIRTLTYAEFARTGMEKQNTTNEGGEATNTRKSEMVRQRNGSRDAEGSTTGAFILTGGFPCQPFSQAGRRRGEEDDRFLWPEMLRVIREFSPLWVIAENVRGLLTQGGGVVFERVCTDLETAGYEVQPLIIPAVAVGAPHRRDRVWFVAHSNDAGSRTPASETLAYRKESSEERKYALGGADGQDSDAQNPQRERRGRRSDGDTPGRGRKIQATRSDTARDGWKEHWLTVATRLCRVDDGLPKRLDRNPRLKALGNAIVPQVAEEIMRAILMI